MDAYRGYGTGLQSVRGEDRGLPADPDARSRTAAHTQSSVPRSVQRWGAADGCCRRLQGGLHVSGNAVFRASLMAGVIFAVMAIPLQQAYIYQASPADSTLKTMLGRWARDARLTLSYLHPNDYTLHSPVAQIRTGSLEDAASALSAAYAEQGVRVVVERPRIIVSQSLPPPADAAPSAPTGD